MFMRRTAQDGVVSEAHQRLLNALANGLSKEGVRVDRLDRRGMTEPFDVQYRYLSDPPPVGGKIPDLQGVDGRGRIHIGEADTSASDSQTQAQLQTFVRHVMRNPSFLHVAVPLECANDTKNTILRAGWERRAVSEIWVWAFRKIGQAYFSNGRLRVR